MVKPGLGNLVFYTQFPLKLLDKKYILPLLTFALEGMGDLAMEEEDAISSICSCEQQMGKNVCKTRYFPFCFAGFFASSRAVVELY